jgi:hypothetical protein
MNKDLGWGSTPPTLPCQKVRLFLRDRPPPTPLSPLPDGRTIRTGINIQQDVDPGFANISSDWADTEDGDYVFISTETPGNAPNQWVLSIKVDNPNDQAVPGSIHGVSGGIYNVPARLGPVHLTAVTGSLATRDLVVSFAGPSGSGSFTAADSAMSLSSTAGSS